MSFAYILWLLVLYFYRISECANKCVSVFVSFYSAFPWGFFLLLYYYNLFVFLSSYYIIFLLLLLFICMLSNERQMGSKWEGK